MLLKIIYIPTLMILFLVSIFFTRVMNKRFKINRWIIASTAPLVIIIPSLIFENISSIVLNILYLIFAVMCIMFFELTRIKLENSELKGVVRLDDNYKKK